MVLEATGIALLLLAGLAAGVVNTLAGAGSLLTVPALILLGVPADVANGTNRVGILAHNLIASWRFHAAGVHGIAPALPLLVPVVAGSLAGAYCVSLLPAAVFQRVFAVVMLVLLVPILVRVDPRPAPPSWPRWLTAAVFFLVSAFGGAFQAGVGLLLIAALAHAGHSLLRANSIKVLVNALQTVVALLVFLARGQVWWLPGLVLAAGYAAGALAGVKLAMAGGEPFVRAFLAVTVLALATYLLGWW